MSGRFYSYIGKIFIAVILPAVIFSGCSEVKPVTDSVRFALFGNTSPGSPFSGFNKSLPQILDEIESYKPQIIIHTGDAVYGGAESDGILSKDVIRQLNLFFPLLRSLKTAVYTVPGDRDYFNGSPALYLENSGKKSHYSFNYGTMHFICLASSDSPEPFVDEKQMVWIKKDLNEFAGSNAIFIIAHHQMFPDRKKIKIHEKNEELHRLFLKYNVKAVFSGSEKDYTTKLKDSIRYINAGCSADTEKKGNRKNFRFYIINYIENRIEIDPVK